MLIHSVCDVMFHRNFPNDFISYLIKEYELYKIMIISPASDSAAACPVNPLTADLPFRDRRSNIPKRLSADSDR